jgi:N-acetylmuramoyl-L-alanine amidase
MDPYRERLERRQRARERLRRKRLLLAAASAAGVIAAILSAIILAARDSGTQPHASTQALKKPPPTSTSKPSDTSSAPATTTALAAKPLRGRTVAIDPGHNGGNHLHLEEINRLVDAGTLEKPCDTTGTQTAGGYTEAEYNLDVALRLARLLREAGARVVLTRRGDSGWGPCITERAAIGNEAGAEAAISIHADGGPVSGRGFHVIYPPSIPGLTDDIASSSRRLALILRAAFRSGTGMPYATYIGQEGLDVRSDLGGLNLSDVPKVFVETGNMRNPTDSALLVTPRFRQREARALAQGLIRFLKTA